MKMRSVCLLSSMLVVFGVGCQASTTEAPPVTHDSQRHALIPERSLAITEVAIIQNFHLERVLDQLVAQSGIPGMTSLQLFQQFWDTQNFAPGLGLGAHCDDQFTPFGQPGLNDFPWECERQEGFQASVDPFPPLPEEQLYIPIGLFNRFDLAPGNGAHCGEYRIVYAMNPASPLAQQRNYIIFEAILPNPQPSKGLEGCLPVMQLWESFSDPNMAPDEIQQEVERFYFDGFDDFEPVVHVNHYGLMLGGEGYACSTGQIRTNQFVQGPWTMREFKLANDCRCGVCELVMVPVTVKDNPFGDLFNESSPEPLVPDLQTLIVSQVASLAEPDINRFGYSVEDRLNAAESPIDDGLNVNHYVSQFLQVPGSGFQNAIDVELANMGSPLQAEHIIARAHALSCAGCHLQSDGSDLGDGLIWPTSLGFTHVNENIVGSPPSYDISQGLKDVFLPYRAELMQAYIDAGGSGGPGGQECRFEMPPAMELSDEECAALAESKGRRPFPTLEIRELRAVWEEGGIIGRVAGH